MEQRYLRVSEAVAEAYPDLRIAAVTARGVDNRTYPADLLLRVFEAEDRLRARLTLEQLDDHPHVRAWRDTYRSFGVKPRSYRPTAEALARRVLRGDPLPNLSPVVDTYLVSCLDHLLPIGGYDVERLDGDIHLECSEGGEPFVPIGAAATEYTKPGEIVYRDANRVLTRRWNYRDADHAKITADSSDVVLCLEAASELITTDSLRTAAEELRGALEALGPYSVDCVVHDVRCDGLECPLAV